MLYFLMRFRIVLCKLIFSGMSSLICLFSVPASAWARLVYNLRWWLRGPTSVMGIMHIQSGSQQGVWLRCWSGPCLGHVLPCGLYRAILPDTAQQSLPSGSCHKSGRPLSLTNSPGCEQQAYSIAASEEYTSLDEPGREPDPALLPALPQSQAAMALALGCLHFTSFSDPQTGASCSHPGSIFLIFQLCFLLWLKA